MTRVHDMGGRFGDGPVVPEPQGMAEFKADWHKGALALTVAAGGLGKWNIDIGRHARESLSVKDYTAFSYYEKWIAALADLLVETGVVSAGELASGQAIGRSDQEPVTGERIARSIAQGGPATRDSDIAPAFVVGDTVRTRRPAANRLIEGGHTRLPQYAAGAQGRILLQHGAHVLPDSNAHRLGDAAEPLYTVVFKASELWAAPEHRGDEVTLDLWQSYLEPA
ncbi:MAG: nitrile hydratase subunit beta [Rhodobacteraceae bacterium]|nr:nitrile hydratase subunit beta [Paracoccaceae bacterium]